MVTGPNITAIPW